MSEPKKRNQYEIDKRNYDHVHVQLPKGEKEGLQAHSAAHGESLNMFINRAIQNEVKADIEFDEAEAVLAAR